MKYPTIQQIIEAEIEQLCSWQRFLPLPKGPIQAKKMKFVDAKITRAGGVPFAISKKLGWNR